MKPEFVRSALLLSENGINSLGESTVLVFGIGGVGGYVCEALARSGVGHFVLVDHDTVCVTNINRQIIATSETLGQHKVDVMKKRILSINSAAKVDVHKMFYLDSTQNWLFAGCDYVIDAIDTVAGKLNIVEAAKQLNIPVISAMGCGNKLDPTRFVVADISETSYCPLCKVMRKELKARKIYSLKVVYSKEQAITPAPLTFTCSQCKRCDNHLNPTVSHRRSTPGSVAFVPSVAGLIIASEVVRDLAK